MLAENVQENEIIYYENGTRRFERKYIDSLILARILEIIYDTDFNSDMFVVEKLTVGWESAYKLNKMFRFMFCVSKENASDQSRFPNVKKVVFSFYWNRMMLFMLSFNEWNDVNQFSINFYVFESISNVFNQFSIPNQFFSLEFNFIAFSRCLVKNWLNSKSKLFEIKLNAISS